MSGSDQRKAAIMLAHRIVADSLRRHAGPTWPLHNERQMTQTYGVGRETVRQALRLLEFQGIVDIRPGRRGGATMIRPAPYSLAQNLTLLMQLHGTPARSILEARTVIEPLAAGLAAQHGAGGRHADLLDAIDQMRLASNDIEAFRAADRRFHVVLAESAGNVLLECLVDSLFRMSDAVVSIRALRSRHLESAREHVAIRTALVRGDPAAAEHAMRSHLLAEERAARRDGDLLSRPVMWRSHPLPGLRGERWKR